MTFLSEGAEREIIDKVVEAVFSALDTCAESDSNSSRFLQTNQATEYCNVSRQTLQRWVEERGLPQAKIGGVILYDIQDLNEFIAKHKI